MNKLPLCLLLLLLCQPTFAQELDFNLPNLQGHSVKLSPEREGNLTVVCFMGTECPLAKLYAQRLNELDRSFEKVNVIGVSSNQQDSVDDLRAYAKKFEIAFPIVKDARNIVADRYQAERTPEVFLLDSQLQIRYRGRIDDQYEPGKAKDHPRREDLKIAIEECLSGATVSVPRTEVDGCLIGRVRTQVASATPVTYANQISRILLNHCRECHRDGEIGPMGFDDYDEVVGWSDMILEVVQENRMPPWHADPAHGQFTNERRMTKAEKDLLREWVEAGSPLGDINNMPEFTEVATNSEWRLPREPDVIIPMRKNAFDVKPTGTIDYQYYVVDPGFETDRWVTAAEILPGNRKVVHHSIVFIRPPDGSGFRGIGWLAAYVPGQSAPTFNPKYGRRIPAGSKLVFQQHYTPTGSQEEDITRIGLVFGEEEEIENEVFTLAALNQDFLIPPNVSKHIVNGKFKWLPEQGQLLGFAPHMHYRGKSFRLTAQNEKEEQVLLDVPNYDFNWQHIYQLQKPIPFDEIESMSFEAAFDNSSENAANPNPQEYISWGDQTWEEMAVVFAMVSVPRESKADIASSESSLEVQAAREKRNREIKEKAAVFVAEYFERFDKDSDGRVTRSELPRGLRTYGFDWYDHNNDGSLSREEIQAEAEHRFQNK